MSTAATTNEHRHDDVAPGDEHDASQDISKRVVSYLVGFVLAALLSAVSFYMTHSTLVWAPSIPIALSVLAIAQMGVHLVFFLHITTGPDNTNNVLALAFGLLVVFLVVGGTVWIMSNLNRHEMPMDQVMKMQR